MSKPDKTPPSSSNQTNLEINAEIEPWKRLVAQSSPSGPPTEELIRRYLAAEDEEAAWDNVMVLQYRGTPEVFGAARRLCASTDPKERELGADILGQLGIPERTFPDESVTILLQMLDSETDTNVLRDIAIALGHLDDARAIEPLIRLKSHPSEDVRFGVVHGLSGHEDSRAIRTLIELSGDTDSDVREWALFGLSLLTSTDTEEIRSAFVDRLTDPDGKTRKEALLALAKLRDERVIVPLINELSQDTVDSELLGAAASLGDPRLCPALVRAKELGGGSEVDEALEGCKCESQSSELTSNRK